MFLKCVVVKGVVGGCHGITMQLIRCAERFKYIAVWLLGCSRG